MARLERRIVDRADWGDAMLGTSAEEQEWYAEQEAVLRLLAWHYRDNEHYRSEWADLRGLG